MSIRTPLCELLGIEQPILSVGFGVSARAELAAAVSNAGGCGVLGLRGPVEAVRDLIAQTRALTRRTFGGNFIIANFGTPHATEDARTALRRNIEAAIDERVPVLVLFWGDPRPFVTPAHRQGMKVLLQVGSPAEALDAARAGVDAVILQGVEAGGHVKATRSIWETLPETVALLGALPVLVSGGIGDGRDIARALTLGAQGVSLGTRFVASEEAWIHADYKRRVVEATGDDTELTPDLYNIGWQDAPHRALKNRTYRAWDAAGRPPAGLRPGEGETVGTLALPWGAQTLVRYQVQMVTPTFDGDPEDMPMWAGVRVDAVRAVRPAAEIVAELVRETEAALAR